MVTKPTIYNSSVRPSRGDLVALSEFLNRSTKCSEKDLQRLLEQHPAIIGLLGYCEFFSEYPVYKKDRHNQTVLNDARRRDRADIIAAKHAPVSIDPAREYRSTHILELKRANLAIAGREIGSRLSIEASQALGQLGDYRRWLTTIPENQTVLSQIGWDVRLPSLSLIMGRDHEFSDNPGQLDEIKSYVLDTHGVMLFTVDDLLTRMEEAVGRPTILLTCSALSFSDEVDSENEKMLVLQPKLDNKQFRKFTQHVRETRSEEAIIALNYYLGNTPAEVVARQEGTAKEFYDSLKSKEFSLSQLYAKDLGISLFDYYHRLSEGRSELLEALDDFVAQRSNQVGKSYLEEIMEKPGFDESFPFGPYYPD